MVNLFLILLCIYIVIYCFKNKVVIRFDTLFRKGFRRAKDKYGVYCWVGKQGDGKTYSCCDFINEIRGNKKVITNQKKYADLNKSFAIYNNDFYDIIRKFASGEYDKNCIIFYDELFTLLEKGALNRNILVFISQLRKRSIYLVTTVQEWKDINVTFRRYVRYQVDCSMFNFLGLFAVSVNYIHNGYEMRWDNIENDYVAPIIMTTFKKCSKAVADSYDTYEVINML